jgi:rhamnose utilization protein RhaD (predicted bifunctional aldolase and dehydrogenase)/NAD(P)-dependent dehydrogenase (short-subunit alcohol dehydrogenase family)
MQSRWSDADAEVTVERYAKAGVNRDLALRVYTTRLLGGDPRLVLHGGGNTSVKTRLTDLNGDLVDVLCVKGSGGDMARIEPAGLPAVRLAPLLKLRSREKLPDEEMVRLQRANLIDPASPNPSVETLLHAFLPHAFVDHTHAAAVLSLTDQPDPEALCREVFGARMGYVPYVMPGFALAKAAADVFDKDPSVEGLILLNHGIFTFGATAREAYERMIAFVTLAEARIAAARATHAGKPVLKPAALPAEIAPLAEIAPILRGAASLADPAIEGAWSRPILEFRTSPAIRAFVDGRDLDRYATEGVVTPDNIIRIKNKPLILAAPEAGRLDHFATDAAKRVAVFTADYERMFQRNDRRVGGGRKMLEPTPRLILVPGVGLFGLGATRQAARIAADVAEIAVEVITDAETVGRYRALPEADLFDVEYWPLEQAKLGKDKPKPLQGQVAVVTGATGTIGFATAAAFAEAGAEVALLDLDLTDATDHPTLGPKSLALHCDVTNPASVRAAFDAICEKLGGVDIVVSNAGAAWQGRIGEVSDATLRKSFELNFFAHQTVAQNAVRIMLAQATGGCLLFNVSKQAVNPGPDFGPYGLPKAATLALMRQYAVDYGKEGIRSNAVNADRIRSGLLDDRMVAARSKARGVSEKEYMSGNLLQREVTAFDVAQAFVQQALALKTTGNVVTVDGGNIAAALR